MTAYLRPASLDEAIKMRAENPDFTVIAGGTDLMVGATERPFPTGILDLFGLSDMVGVRIEDDWIHIGAATTYAELMGDPLVNDHLPSLQAAASEVGAAQIQARGTIGGNIANSSPAGDLLPVLLVLEASVVLVSQRTERQIPYCQFCTDYRQTAMDPDELIAEIKIPIPPLEVVQYWRKVGTRSAQATSKVMVAGFGKLDGKRLIIARLSAGSIANRPIRLTAVEELLLSNILDGSLLERVHQLINRTVEPISDIRSTASYRRMVTANLVSVFLEQLLDIMSATSE